MNFLGGSFPIGRLFGITIRVHFLFLIFIAFELWDAGRSGDWTREALFLGMLFGIVLLHEFGHCLGARAVGGYAEDILLWPLGGLAYARAPMRPWPQFVTVAAGPLVNVAFCLLSAAGIFLLSRGALLPGLNPLHPGLHVLNPARVGDFLLDTRWIQYLIIFYHVNLFLLGFNLLPIFPLDGGQLFQAILWKFLGLQRATLLACQVGLVGCVIFAFLGLRGTGGNMLVFIAMFGGFTSWQRLQAARHGLLVEDSRFEIHGPSHNPRPWWQRIFRTGGRPSGRPPSSVEFPSSNPNPGGWAERQAHLQDEDAELDRILQKVSAQGIHSLSYVERQTLERITRERQTRERDLQRNVRP
jgi:Zn-dependent protease